ncbi:MAG TPA: sigma-70 family RNA polymerase sigma factor [Chthoniobacterales bacterium]|nr:sigma-70 family RNA polymerase sigma factor [Chthoniobacterales bacterium]
MENVGNDESWKTCFEQIGPGLLLFARQWTDSMADAEDIVQEAFVRFWRKEHPASPEARRTSDTGGAENVSDFPNRGLLYAMVRSIALDFLRRNSRRERREAVVVAETGHSVAPHFETGDDSQRELAAAVAVLPKEQREVLVMKIWNELTFAEIASVLGISQNTAASRYRYALAALKKNLPPQ